jgi:hypothetical protein
MADADTEARRYREMANDIRALVPMLKHPHTEAAWDLRLLAIRYERLAQYLATGCAVERAVLRQAS